MNTTQTQLLQAAQRCIDSIELDGQEWRIERADATGFTAREHTRGAVRFAWTDFDVVQVRECWCGEPVVAEDTALNAYCKKGHRV